MDIKKTNQYGIDRISPSGLMEYKSCPRLFYFRTWLKLKLPQSQVHLDFGTAIHEAIDVLYGNRNERGTWNDDSSAYKALEVFQAKFTPTSVKDLTKTEKGVTRNLTAEEKVKVFTEMTQDGIEIIRAYWSEKEILLSQGVDPVKFEIPGKDIMFNPLTKEPLPIPMSYRLDAELRNLDVGEFKTSAKPYDQFETRARPQSLCYVWVQYQRTGRIPDLHYVVMLKNTVSPIAGVPMKKKREKIQYLRFKYDLADILSFDKEVRATLEKIKNREFDRPLKSHPFMCDCDRYEKALSY